MFKRVSCMLMLVSLGGCVTIPWPNVMYSPQGDWLVVSTHSERADSIRRAYGAAQHHCAQQQKRVMLLSDVTVFQGPLGEAAHEASKMGRDAMRIYGEFEEWQLANALPSTGEYRTTLEFRCQ